MVKIKDIAKKCGVSIASVARWETGENEPTTSSFANSDCVKNILFRNFFTITL